MLLAPLLATALSGHCTAERSPRLGRRGAQMCVVPARAEAAAADGALALLRELLETRGRCSLAEAGERLRAEGVDLPVGQSLSAFAESRSELVLSGRPSNRQLSLARQTTASALVRFVAGVLSEMGGAASPAELKLRISERGRFVPGLAALLRAHTDTFEVADGVVALRGSLPGEEVGGVEGGGDAPLVLLPSELRAAPRLARLQRLGLSRQLSDGSLAPEGQAAPKARARSPPPPWVGPSPGISPTPSGRGGGGGSGQRAH